MTRAEHTAPDKHGCCHRCAVFTNMNGGRCPPGYWMTKKELAEWELLTTTERREMEKTLGAQPAPKRKR